MKSGLLLQAILAGMACAACGGNVVTEPTSNNNGGAGGTPGTGAEGGMSGVAGGTSGGTGGLFDGVGGSTSVPVCPPGDYFVTLEQDGVVSDYVNGCGFVSPIPSGSLSGGGECFAGLIVRACGADGDTPYVFVSSDLEGPGATMLAYIDHVDAAGAYWSGNTGSMTVTSFGEVGDVIEGSYTVEGTTIVEGQPTTATFQGTFRVCRTPDEPPCP